MHAIKTLLCCISENILCKRSSEFGGFYVNNDYIFKKNKAQNKLRKSQEKDFDCREKYSEFQGEKKKKQREKKKKKENLLEKCFKEEFCK